MKLFDRKLRHAEQRLMTGMDTFISVSGPPKRNDDDTMMKHITLYMVFTIAVHSLCCAGNKAFRSGSQPFAGLLTLS